MSVRRCYRCEAGRPALNAQGLCGECAIEVRAEANRPPLTEHCKGCGHRFLNDWERIKHEVHKLHHYRAWTGREKSA